MVTAIQSVIGTEHLITAETNILCDLSLDSVAVMDVIMHIETQFDTMIPMNQFAEIQTVGDLTQVIIASKKTA
ncbi:acyl carrier protein [Pseudoroseomonas sp. WGS1072]|uniref:acyl carrier protein n=1 Tax=Roseomonas sp. WGS1072 TaxID=3366816 RepID=UPI003BF2B53A